MIAFIYARSMPARNLYFVDVSVLVIRPAQSFIYEMNKFPSLKKLNKSSRMHFRNTAIVMVKHNRGFRFEGAIGLFNLLGRAHSKSNRTKIFQRYQSNDDQLESLLVYSLRTQSAGYAPNISRGREGR